MNNDDIPSLDDALKEFETVKQTVNNNTPIETIDLDVTPKVVEESNNVVNNTQSAYKIDGKNYSSLTEMMEEQEKNHVKPPSNNPNDYLLHYIGDKYDVFEKGGISFCYFFFGEYYLIFRKMYIPAIVKYLITVGLCILIIVAYLMKTISLVFIGFGALIFLQIIPIFIVKKFYFNYAKGRVKKILETNKGKSYEEICKICDKKGGTSILAPIILFILLSLLSSFRKYLKYMNLSDLSGAYDITIRDLHTKSTSYLGFDAEKFDNQTRIINNECSVSINTQLYTPDIKINADNSKEIQVNINGYDWLYLTNGNKEALVTSEGGYLYTIQIIDYRTNDNCKKSTDILIKYLQFE